MMFLDLDMEVILQEALESFKDYSEKMSFKV
jgi:hypothetical protein